MINLDLISFLDNSHKITSFERIRKIYDLTNNLDAHLLEDLRKEVVKYYRNKYEKRVHKFIHNNKSPLSDSDYITYILTNNKSFDELTDYKKYIHYQIREIIDAPTDFADDLTKLISRGNDFLKGTENEETQFGKVDVNEKMIQLEELISRGNKLLERTENEGSRDSDRADAKEKMIYLEKLGIIDYLIKELPAKTSKTKIAELLAIIIGETKGNIQSYLSAIIRKDSTNKNPLSNADDVNFIVNKLFRDYRYTPEQK